MRFSHYAAMLLVVAGACAAPGVDNVTHPSPSDPPSAMVAEGDDANVGVASLDPQYVGATVWWSGAMLNAKGYMRYLGNYARIHLRAWADQALMIDETFVNSRLLDPSWQFFETPVVSRMTSAACGQTATGAAGAHAEIRLMSTTGKVPAGFAISEAEDEGGAAAAAQPSCRKQVRDSTVTTGSGGGRGDDAVTERVYYVCYFIDYYEGDVWVGREDLGCIVYS